MSDLYWLDDAQMARLEPYFPKSHGKPRVDNRRVLSGIIFIDRNGLRWRDAPKEYGLHKTLYNRWKRWSEKGVFAQIMMGLAVEYSEENQTTNALASANPVKSPKNLSCPTRRKATRPSTNNLRNSRDSTRTCRKNPGLQAIHQLPSGDKPPPGTIRNDHVDVWVMHQRGTPRVEHVGDTDLRADPPVC